MAQGNGEEVAWFDELVADIRGWHDAVLQVSGGAPGENTARLLGACGRPFQGSGDDEFYVTDMEKAAALFHAIICDHVFVDGNKRTATVAAILFLAARGVLSEPPSPLQVRLLGDVAVEAASAPFAVDDVFKWFHRILDP